MAQVRFHKRPPADLLDDPWPSFSPAVMRRKLADHLQRRGYERRMAAARRHEWAVGLRAQQAKQKELRQKESNGKAKGATKAGGGAEKGGGRPNGAARNGAGAMLNGGGGGGGGGKGGGKGVRLDAVVVESPGATSSTREPNGTA